MLPSPSMAHVPVETLLAEQDALRRGLGEVRVDLRQPAEQEAVAGVRPPSTIRSALLKSSATARTGKRAHSSVEMRNAWSALVAETAIGPTRGQAPP